MSVSSENDEEENRDGIDETEVVNAKEFGKPKEVFVDSTNWRYVHNRLGIQGI